MFEKMPWMVDGREKTLDLSNDWKRPFSSHPFLFERGGTKSVWYGSGFNYYAALEDAKKDADGMEYFGDGWDSEPDYSFYYFDEVQGQWIESER